MTGSSRRPLPGETPVVTGSVWRAWTAWSRTTYVPDTHGQRDCFGRADLALPLYRRCTTRPTEPSSSSGAEAASSRITQSTHARGQSSEVCLPLSSLSDIFSSPAQADLICFLFVPRHQPCRRSSLGGRLHRRPRHREPRLRLLCLPQGSHQYWSRHLVRRHRVHRRPRDRHRQHRRRDPSRVRLRRRLVQELYRHGQLCR